HPLSSAKPLTPRRAMSNPGQLAPLAKRQLARHMRAISSPGIVSVWPPFRAVANPGEQLP
ncbi:MAG: hypothetical protein KJ703_06835, partial [Alphaproteobacteria bacterium]|nr:hypothetical protein [Alphaproteobacteria bacterium]